MNSIFPLTHDGLVLRQPTRFSFDRQRHVSIHEKQYLFEKKHEMPESEALGGVIFDSWGTSISFEPINPILALDDLRLAHAIHRVPAHMVSSPAHVIRKIPPPSVLSSSGDSVFLFEASTGDHLL